VFENVVSGSPLMNVDGRASQENELIIWNGTGAGDTGGDWTLGGTADTKEELPAADRGFGTNGLHVATAKNKYVTFTNGSTIQADTYVNLVIWVKTLAHPAGSTVPSRLTLAGDQVGSWCYLGSYIDEWTPGVWKKVEIPIADFGLDPGQMIDGLRIDFLVKSGQEYYFDDIHLEQAGGQGAQTYRLQPDPVEEPNDIWHVDYIKLLAVSTQSGWNSSVMFNLASALETGLIMRMVDDTEGVLWSVNHLDNTDLWGHWTEENFIDFANGTRQIVWRLDPSLGRLILTPTRRLEFVVRDDLSSLQKLRAYANYGREVAA